MFPCFTRGAIGGLADKTTQRSLLLLPGRMGETGFRPAMGFAASLMFGWTLLLIWGYRRPVERRGLLLITIFPVIAGLVATGIWAVAAGHLPFSQVAPSLIVGPALMGLMGYSYRRSTVALRGGAH